MKQNLPAAVVAATLALALGCSAGTPGQTRVPTVRPSAQKSTTQKPGPKKPSAPGDFGVLHTGKKDGPTSRSEVPAAPRLEGAYRFISAPDFLNQDVADLGTPPELNSTNDDYDVALDRVIGEMASHDTEDLLVAGDLVEGRWGRDDSGSGNFGPVRTDAERTQAMRRAAEVYYPAWRQRMRQHGLIPYPAVGDHEIGDDPWRRDNDRWVAFKRHHVPDFKREFARQMITNGETPDRFMDRPSSGQAKDTAYAVRLDANVLLVTLDVWTLRRGDVHIAIDDAQLAWLKKVLRRAKREAVPWVVVQGHTPIAGPVRYRNSTHLHYEHGRRSELWKAMVAGGVDVYFCGEVHDQTVTVADGIVQVAHGSLFYRGEASYVVGQVTKDELALDNHQFAGRIGFGDRLWTTSRQGAPGHIDYPTASVITGTLTARRTAAGGAKVTSRTGTFGPIVK